METQKMFNEVAALIAEKYKLNIASITRELNFQNDLSLNSLQLVEYVVAIEDHFNIEIPDNMLFRIHTMGDLVDFLEEAH
ncbi:MAG: acyl carrier protein [Rikenellaceae bacterium]